MNKLIKISIYAILVVLCLVGCTYQRSAVFLSPLGLPEEIYLATKLNNDALKVGVFKFTEPPYTPGVGRKAAHCLYQELLRNSVFLNVTSELNIKDIRINNLINIACTKKYDLIITGNLLYYFEGSDHQSSRVDEEIYVFRVLEKKPEILYYAKSVETGPPAPSIDFFIIKGNGAPAPSAMALMERNAKKFSKLLLTLHKQPLQHDEYIGP